MKIAFTLLVILCTVFSSGCTTVSPPGTTPAPSTTVVLPGVTASPVLPALTGTWTGPMRGYDEGIGFSEYPNLTMVMVVSDQHGRLFSGHMLFNENGTEWTTDIAGAIGRDNRTLSLTEKDGGYCFGEVLGQDEIELTYMQDGSPYSIAIDSLKRG